MPTFFSRIFKKEPNLRPIPIHTHSYTKPKCTLCDEFYVTSEALYFYPGIDTQFYLCMMCHHRFHLRLKLPLPIRIMDPNPISLEL